MAIRKRNAKEKDHRKDSFISALRMPFDEVFSKMSHRARYRSRNKVYFQALMEALVFNFKRLIAINSPPIRLA